MPQLSAPNSGGQCLIMPGRMSFVVDKVALRWVFSLTNSRSTNCSTFINRPASEAISSRH